MFEAKALMVAGIAGKYAAGKNLAVTGFEERGFLVIDVDRLGHRALEARGEEVVAVFGPGVRDGAGGIDRRALGRIVFADPRELERLERIVHPEMKRMVRRSIAENPGRNVCINAALLFHMGLDELCDFIIWVKAPFLLRLRRAMRRDNLSFLDAARRLVRQRTLKPQHSSRPVDIYTVENSGEPGELKRAVGEILSGKGL